MPPSISTHVPRGQAFGGRVHRVRVSRTCDFLTSRFHGSGIGGGGKTGESGDEAEKRQGESEDKDGDTGAGGSGGDTGTERLGDLEEVAVAVSLAGFTPAPVPPPPPKVSSAFIGMMKAENTTWPASRANLMTAGGHPGKSTLYCSQPPFHRDTTTMMMPSAPFRTARSGSSVHTSGRCNSHGSTL
jgi:hypothetical protein